VKRRRTTHEYTDASRGVRLQKVLAEAGIASRRACEELIQAGSVDVNGTIITSLPAWVDPAVDKIRIHGKPLRPAERHIYLMLNKPRGVVTTNSDPEGRPLAIDLVHHPAKPRLFTVGRLDIDTSGLLLLTNDGELANRLAHPRYEMAKGYEMMVGGTLSDDNVRALEADLFGHPKDARADRAKSSLRIINREADRTHLYMELVEGPHRQVRELMLRVGRPVKRLRRVSVGPLQLKGVAVGRWRELTIVELAMLRKAAFPKAVTSTAKKPLKRQKPALGQKNGKRRPAGARPRRPSTA
jgi:23S rRNA pseudouridine2605 synthase